MKILLYVFLFALVCINHAVAVPCSATIPQGTSEQCDSITKNGITWTLDQNRTVGQFVNGDYWVIDPGSGVRIINISPGHTASPRVMNGSMINPGGSMSENGHYDTHGYDAFGWEWAGVYPYRAALNVGVGISTETPLVLQGTKTLVSTISNEQCGDLGGGNHVSYVKSAAVLTSVEAEPLAGSFRPGISGTTKVFHNASQIRWDKLKSLAATAATRPDIVTYEGYFTQPWLVHVGNYLVARYMHPSDGGRGNYYYTNKFSIAALLLNSDYSNNDKAPLLYKYIQAGIDAFSYVIIGGRWWSPDGGLTNARVWPILFAGAMLDDSAMLGIGDVPGPGLGNENDQTFYVTPEMVGFTPQSGLTTYSAAHVGMPDWMDKEVKKDSSWNASTYRSIGSGAPAWIGEAVAAVVMGVKLDWNHPPFFDYMERYMSINKDGTDPFGYSVVNQSTPLSRGDVYSQDMYDTYWHVYNPRQRRLFRNVRLADPVE